MSMKRHIRAAHIQTYRRPEGLNFNNDQGIPASIAGMKFNEKLPSWEGPNQMKKCARIHLDLQSLHKAKHEELLDGFDIISFYK